MWHASPMTVLPTISTTRDGVSPMLWHNTEIKIDYMRGSGPGGQHRNTSETGVRVRHLPSGIMVTATESRSRQQNLQRAFLRLEERLKALQKHKRPRFPTKPSRAADMRRLKRKRLIGEKKQSRKKIER